MKKIINVLIIGILIMGMVGCSSVSQEPIEYDLSVYNLKNPVGDLIIEDMIVGVNTDKLSNEEAIKIVESVNTEGHSPRVMFIDNENKLIANSSILEDDSIHIEFEPDKECKSDREIVDVSDKTMLKVLKEKAEEKLEAEKLANEIMKRK